MTDKRTTLVLSVIAASLLAFILLFERGTLSTSDVARRSGHVLTRFVRDQVTQVSLARGDEEPIVLERQPPPEGDEEAMGVWGVAAPVHAEADQDAVDSFLGALEWLMADRTLTGVTAEDRARYGLDHPRFVVRYRVAEEAGRLVVGGEAPEGQGIYVAADDDSRAFVVRADLVESIDHDLAHFRDKDLFPDDFYSTDATSDRLEGAEAPMVFEKDGDLWHVREPVRGWANAGAVDALLRLPREVHAARFVAEGAAGLDRYGLDSPWRELSITRPESAHGTRSGRLRVGDVCGEHTTERYAIAGDEGPVVCVLTSELDALALDPAAVREGRLVSVGADAVERITLESGGRTLTLRRAESGWELANGDAATPADDGAISEWLRQLRDARAAAFEPIEGDAPGHGLAAPRATLTIARSDSEAETVVRLGESDAEGAWVRRGDEPSAVRFDASVAELFQVGPLRFRGRALVHEDAANARAVTVRRSDGEERAARGQGGTWQLEAPIEAEADRVVVRELVRQLTELRAERFVAEQAAPEHGLGSPRLTVSARFAEDGSVDARTVTLRVGAATSEGAYAQLEGDDAVFVLSSQALEALDARLVSLDLLTVDTSDATGLRVERDGAVVADLSRQGGAWRLADGAAPDADRTQALVDRLSTLRASGVVRYGAPDGSLGLEPPATRITVTRADGSTTIDLGRDQGEGDAAFVPARRSGLDVIYRFSPELVSALRTYTP